MQTILQGMVEEFQEEAATTKRVLERVPQDKLAWRPHPTSMSLGQLALHIAGIPGHVLRVVQSSEFDVANSPQQVPEPANVGEIHAAFEKSVGAAEEFLKGMNEQSAMENWRLVWKGKEVFSRPRLTMVRKIMFNHWYHHRGQLSVYLRELDVPVPVIYGRSADENPFA